MSKGMAARSKQIFDDKKNFLFCYIVGRIASGRKSSWIYLLQHQKKQQKYFYKNLNLSLYVYWNYSFSWATDNL